MGKARFKIAGERNNSFFMFSAWSLLIFLHVMFSEYENKIVWFFISGLINERERYMNNGQN